MRVFLTVWAVWKQNRLPREAADALSLDIFQQRFDRDLLEML